MAYDFATAFTAAAHVALPSARLRGIRCAFDYRGPACRIAGEAQVSVAITQLGLRFDAVDGAAEQPRLRRARGPCPMTAAPIEFSSLHGEGLLFSVVYALPTLPCPPAAAPPLPAAIPRRAWLIGTDRVAREALSRRLLRDGWSARGFDAIEQAVRRLPSLHDAG